MEDICKNSNKPISKFLAVLRPNMYHWVIKWDYLQVEASTQVFPLLTLIRPGKRLWGIQQDLLSFLTLSIESFIGLRSAVQRNRQEFLRIYFIYIFFSLWFVGSGGNRNLHQEWHDMRTASLAGSWQAQGTAAVLHWALLPLWRSPEVCTSFIHISR